MIITSIDQLKEHVPVSIHLTFGNISPYIKDAEESILIPHLGEELYTNVTGQVTSGNVLEEIDQELLKKMQLVISRFALSYYIPHAEVTIGDDGITTVGKSENRTAAYDRQVTRLQESTIRQAWDALDRLMGFLEKNADSFPSYKDSEAYIRFQRGLIRDTKTFNDIYYIANSRLTFQAIHPELMNVEEDRLIPLITKEKYDVIHAGGTLDDNYSRLLSYARKGVIFQAVANVIQLQQNVNLDANTLRIYENSDEKYYKKPSERDRNEAAAKAQARADWYWDNISGIISEMAGEDDDFEAGIIDTEKLTLL